MLPVVEGIGFAAEYVPTGDAAEVGGDFYDVVPLPDDRWLVVVGDVSGKGVQAAAVTGLVRDVIRVLVRDGRPLPETLARLNDTLVERGGGRFCTLALAAVGRGRRRRRGSTSRCTWPATTGRSWSARTARRPSSGTGGTALGLLDTVATPVGRQSRCGPATRWSSTPTASPSGGAAGSCSAPSGCATRPPRWPGTPPTWWPPGCAPPSIGFSSEPPRDDIAILVLRNDFLPG